MMKLFASACLCTLVLLFLPMGCSSTEEAADMVTTEAVEDGLTVPDGFQPIPDMLLDLTGKETTGTEIVTLPSCGSDDECSTGQHCLPSYSGMECLPECLSQGDCPEGYYCKAMSAVDEGILFVCLPDLPQVCLPCSSDEQCNDGVCIEIDELQRCATFCTTEGGCPVGYDCTDVGAVVDGEPDLGLCTPTSGSCECSEKTAGQKRPCFDVGTEGTCKGFETCDPASGWVDCDAPAPVDEDCDGLDNDCDGQIDEGLPETTPCEETTEGIGTCTGTAVCAGQLGWLCDAPVPAAETCDYLDNDCDGVTDEEFKEGEVYSHESHCGACNIACEGTILHGTAMCDTTFAEPVCAVASCDEGYYAVGKFQCLEADVDHCRPCSSDMHCGGGVCMDFNGASFCTEACEGDDDCPDAYDCVEKLDYEGVLLGTFCLPANGTCDCAADNDGEVKACAITNEFGTCFGSQTCDQSLGWVGCSAAVPEEEICDGLDNDCNGVPDDSLPVDMLCEVEIDGVGTCPGLALCFGSQGWICNAPAPEAEKCDDWDNDCDGETDEDFKTDGLYLMDDHCGSCEVACADQLPNATSACALGTDGVPGCVVLECAPGFYQVSETLCLKVSTVLCTPCNDDGDCAGGTCLTDPEGKQFCSRPCDADGLCPDDFTCTDLGAPIGEMCLPTSGDCLCTKAEAGMTRPCYLTNPSGTCYGYETCDPDAGWTNCTALTPAVEDCNAIDDDCDGAVDEFLGGTSCEVTNEHGTCTGTQLCKGGAWSCTAGTPAEEVCNYLDDDCSGVADDPFKVDGQYLLFDHCGGCGNSCAGAVPNGTAACSLHDGLPACVVTTCEDGFVKLNDFACVAQPAIVCLPCEGDDDCLGGICHDDGSGTGTFCTIDCSSAGCPAGYSCSDVDGTELCLPTSGTCDCDGSKDGTVKACEVTNEHGTCSGLVTCDAATGWGPCNAAEPAEEICNGLDDDCDGLVDEGFTDPTPCEETNEHGTCTGTAYCLGAAGIVCDAAVPAAETCNFADDDCDGATDEDFLTGNLYLTGANCGTCGNDCGDAIVHATADCGLSPIGSPVCMVVACDEGYVAINDFSCIVPPDTSCKPCDDDGDCFGASCTNLSGQLFCLTSCELNDDCSTGYMCQDIPGLGEKRCIPASGSCSCTDTNDGAKRVCSFANESGECFGFETCEAGSGWTECDADIPSDELCNGKDDNCDGAVDEGLTDSQPCTKDNAFGSCAGTAECVGSLGWVCDAPEPSVEVCDGLDNDCDGETDEDGATGCVPRYADADGDGYGLDGDSLCLCTSDGIHTVFVGGDCDDTSATVSPSAAEVCNEVDDDCDGVTDEEGAGACVPYYLDGDGDGYGVAGASKCLCGPSGQYTAASLGDCDDTDGTMSPGSPEVCDGDDEDCDGLVDEEGATGCTNYYRDMDGDTYGQDDDVHCLCEPAAPYTVLTGGDCNDQIPSINPLGVEVCNLFDDDCDGELDEEASDCLTFYRDEDGDGFGITGDTLCLCLPEAPYEAVADGDCDDAVDTISPVAVETCNGIDNNCDGVTDTELDISGCTVYYFDADGDSYGVDGDSVCACEPMGSYQATQGSDCVDDDASINPTSPDPCNGLDDNCDGQTDEGAGDFDGDGIADCVDPCPVYVDQSAGAGGDGSATSPYDTIQEGIDNHGQCSEVWVLAGTYTENVVFGGANVMVKAHQGPLSTTIDGGNTGSAVTFDAGETSAAGLDGFTITGGTGTSGDPAWGDPSLTYGGGVLVIGASPTITGSTITGNSVTGSGGGVFFQGAGGALEGCSVTDNVSSNAGEAGAGVTLQASSTQIHSNTIRGNVATGAGGGLLLLSSGGSIRYNFVVDNTASDGAGIRLTDYGTAIIDGNIIQDNQGDGVSFYHFTSVKFIDNTVVGNTGHGLRLTLCCGSIFAVPLIKNVIIAYNDGNGIRTDYDVNFGLFNTDTYSNSSGNYGGVMGYLGNDNLDITSNNCNFVDFSDNGNPDDDDLHLSNGSPCIDNGGDVTLYMVTRDYEGNPRPVIGGNGTYAQYDRGAYEHQ